MGWPLTARAHGLLLVSGLGRCGTTLLMEMLKRGGFPLLPGGTPIGHEYPELNEGKARLPAGANGAVKWLEPQRWPPPHSRHVRGSIFLVRDHREQARSKIKLLMHGGHTSVSDNRFHVLRMAASLRVDEPAARKALAARGPLITVRFEDLVDQPTWVLIGIQRFLGVPLDVSAAAEALLPRPTGAACLPSMLEFELIERGAR